MVLKVLLAGLRFYKTAPWEAVGGPKWYQEYPDQAGNVRHWNVRSNIATPKGSGPGPFLRLQIQTHFLIAWRAAGHELVSRQFTKESKDGAARAERPIPAARRPARSPACSTDGGGRCVIIGASFRSRQPVSAGRYTYLLKAHSRASARVAECAHGKNGGCESWMKSLRSAEVTARLAEALEFDGVVQRPSLSPTAAQFGVRLPPVECELPCRRQRRERGHEPPHRAAPGNGKSRRSQRAAQAVILLTATAGKIRAAETEDGFDFDERGSLASNSRADHKFHVARGQRTASL